MSKPQRSSQVFVHCKRGNGPVRLLFLHGFFGPTVFDRLISELSEIRFSIVSLRLSGYDKKKSSLKEKDVPSQGLDADGPSEDEGFVCPTELNLLKDIQVHLDLLQWEKFHAVAHSFGASILGRMASNRPSQVMSAVFFTQFFRSKTRKV